MTRFDPELMREITLVAKEHKLLMICEISTGHPVPNIPFILDVVKQGLPAGSIYELNSLAVEHFREYHEGLITGKN